MKLPSLLETIAACLLVSFGGAACAKRSSEPPPPSAQAPEWVRVAYFAERQKRIEAIGWLEATLLAAYDDVGKRDAKWDKRMRRLITAVAEARGWEWIPTHTPIYDHLEALAKSGCDDPLFRYWNARYTRPAKSLTFFECPDYPSVYLVLGRSEYPPLERYWSALRAYQTARGTKREEFFRSQTELQLLETLQDAAMPEVIWMPAVDFFRRNVRSDKAQMPATYAKLESALRANWPESAATCAVIAAMETDLAWLARGTGFANEVPEAAWPKFAQHLTRAEEFATRSWNLRPNAYAARAMLTVELGQGEGRDRYELWFRRTMALEPWNLNACHAKLTYLRPRWYGSHEEMMEFALECIEHPEWRTPTAVARALELITEDMGNEEQAEFWQRPQVWATLKAGYERHFELEPEDAEMRVDYFRAAFRARAWKDAKRQYHKLRGVDCDEFGGPQGLARMLLEIEMNL